MCSEIFTTNLVESFLISTKNENIATCVTPNLRENTAYSEDLNHKYQNKIFVCFRRKIHVYNQL